MVDGNEQKGRGKTTAVSGDAEAEIFITFKWKRYDTTYTHYPFLASYAKGLALRPAQSLRRQRSHLSADLGSWELPSFCTPF